MSLATRCTSCGTVFRVVQDQLKVSEGWVRCGRCNEVFNALEGLFDLEREAPPPWPMAPGVEVIQENDLPEVVAADASDPALVDRIDAAVFSSRTADVKPEAEAAFSEPPAAAPAPVNDAASLIADWDVERPGAPMAAGEPLEAPDFVRHADRAARWQSRGARTVLAVASLLFALLLTAQAAYHFRDLAAAHWPAIRPALAQACAQLGCSLEAPRRIEDISVESTALTRAPGPDAFRLSVTLRNRGALALALPSIDLTLTDTGGQLVARRSLAPRDFRVASAVLQPGAESVLQLLLSAGTPRVTGYTVEIFYP